MLTKKEHTEISGTIIFYDNKVDGGRLVFDLPSGYAHLSLPEARAIHAELTELFKLLDEKV